MEKLFNSSIEDEKTIIIGGLLNKYEIIDFKSRESGFQAMLLKEINSNNYFISYRGTEMGGLEVIKDLIITDILSMGFKLLKNDQFKDSIDVTKEWINDKKLGTDNNCILIGHSLGGTLAQLNSFYFGFETYTFNAFGLDAGQENDIIGTITDSDSTITMKIFELYEIMFKNQNLLTDAVRNVDNIYNFITLSGNSRDLISGGLTDFVGTLKHTHLGDVFLIKQYFNAGLSENHSIKHVNDSLQIYCNLTEKFNNIDVHILTNIFNAYDYIDNQNTNIYSVKEVLYKISKILNIEKSENDTLIKISEYIKNNTKNVSLKSLNLKTKENFDLYIKNNKKDVLYAIKYLNSFVISEDDNLYEKENLEYSYNYFKNKSDFLYYMMHYNDFPSGYYYEDKQTGYILKDTSFDDYKFKTFIFDDDNNTVITTGNTYDNIFSEKGNDIIYTGEGQDIIYFNKGDGHDTIKDLSNDDIIILNNINSSELVFEKSKNKENSSLYDLKIIIDQDNSITIENYINQLKFIETDDKVIYQSEIDSYTYLVLEGTEYNDRLYGTFSLNKYIPKSGDDQIYLISKDNLEDLIIFNIGDGKLTINESDFNDIIEFGKGIKIENIQYILKSGFDFIIVLNTGDTLIIHNYLNTNPYYKTDLRYFRFSETNQEITYQELISIIDSKYSIPIDVSSQVYTFDGNDEVIGNSNANYINTGKGNDYIEGQSGNDYLFGLDGNDTIDGGFGIDTIYGGSDNDTLIGGQNDDNLYGHTGDDIYIFETNHGNDKITEYSGFDTIILKDFSKEEITYKRYRNDIYIQTSDTSSINMTSYLFSDSDKIEKIIDKDGYYLDSVGLNNVIQKIISSGYPDRQTTLTNPELMTYIISQWKID